MGGRARPRGRTGREVGEGMRWPGARMHPVAGQRALPAATDAPGVRGSCAFRDEGEPDRAVSVPLLDSREDAVRWHERVVGTAREELGDVARGTPEVTTGETVVLAAA